MSFLVNNISPTTTTKAQKEKKILIKNNKQRYDAELIVYTVFLHVVLDRICKEKKDELTDLEEKYRFLIDKNISDVRLSIYMKSKKSIKENNLKDYFATYPSFFAAKIEALYHTIHLAEEHFSLQSIYDEIFNMTNDELLTIFDVKKNALLYKILSFVMIYSKKKDLLAHMINNELITLMQNYIYSVLFYNNEKNVNDIFENNNAFGIWDGVENYAKYIIPVVFGATVLTGYGLKKTYYDIPRDSKKKSDSEITNIFNKRDQFKNLNHNVLSENKELKNYIHIIKDTIKPYLNDIVSTLTTRKKYNPVRGYHMMFSVVAFFMALEKYAQENNIPLEDSFYHINIGKKSFDLKDIEGKKDIYKMLAYNDFSIYNEPQKNKDSEIFIHTLLDKVEEKKELHYQEIIKILDTIKDAHAKKIIMNAMVFIAAEKIKDLMGSISLEKNKSLTYSFKIGKLLINGYKMVSNILDSKEMEKIILNEIKNDMLS